MASGVSAGKKEVKASFRDDAKLSKRHMLAIWAALAAALGSQGVPAIVEMLDSKPGVEDVQTMIASQTARLTAQQNMAVEAIKDLHSDVKELRGMSDALSRVIGLVDVLRDVMRDCCTRGHARLRLERPKPTVVHSPKTVSPPLADKPDEGMVDSTPSSFGKKTPFERLQKVPEFDPKNMMQQQLQTQEMLK